MQLPGFPQFFYGHTWFFSCMEWTLVGICAFKEENSQNKTFFLKFLDFKLFFVQVALIYFH